MAPRTVSNTLLKPNGDPIVNMAVEIALVASADTGRGEGWLSASNASIIWRVHVRTDDEGLWSVDLEPNDNITPGNTYYKVTEDPRSRAKAETYEIIVPAGSGALWAGDLLVEVPGDLPDASALNAHINNASDPHAAAGYIKPGELALDNLNDVVAPTPTDQQRLAWDAATSRWIPVTPTDTGAETLPELTDVNGALAPASGDYLRHDGTDWKDSPILEPDIPATIARDAEVTTAVATEATARAAADSSEATARANADTAHEADTTNIHGIADTSALETQAGAQAKVDAHVNDATDAHDASAISSVAAGGLASTDVQAALNELDTEKATVVALDAEATLRAAREGTTLGETTYDGATVTLDYETNWGIDGNGDPYYDPDGVSGSEAAVLVVNPDGSLAIKKPTTAISSDWDSSPQDVQDALDAHLADTADAHDASAISNVPAGGIAATTIQAAIDELDAEKQPIDSDLTAIAGLSPTNDDLVQRKAGAWTNRTPAQVKTDLALAKGDVGLGNVDNTADTAKPVSTEQQTALDAKVSKSLFDANTILAANSDDTPAALSVAEQRLVGRITGGSIDDLSVAQVKTLLAYIASDITNTPAGGIAATTIQAAIDELDTEKLRFDEFFNFITGRYYTSIGTTATALFTADNQARYIPFWVPATKTFDRIGLEVTGAGSSGSVIRLGIHNNSAGVPGTVVLDAGTINGTSATAQEITINQQLTRGLYWLVAAAQVLVGTTRPTVRAITAYGFNVGGTLADTAQAAYFATVSGALAASPSLSAGATTGPAVKLRAA